MCTARNDGVDFLRGALREIGLTVLGWIGALTALYVVFRTMLPSFEDELARAGAGDSAGEFIPGADGSPIAGWLDWVGAYVLGDSGYSIQFARPVAEVLGEASGLSILLLFIMIGVTVLVGAIGVAITVRLGDRKRPLVVVPAYAFGLLLPLVALLFLVWVSYGLQVLPTGLAGSPETAAMIQLGLAVVVSVVVALPVVGDAIRRVNRAGVGSTGRIPARMLLGRRPGGFGTVELWTYVFYLLGTLVVIENVFQYPGLGYMLVQAVNVLDYPLLFGVVAQFVAILVAFALVRNLGWVVVRTLSDSDHSGNDRGQTVGDRQGTTAEGVRNAQPVQAGRQAGGESSAPTAGTLWRAFASRTKTKAAAGLFAVAVLFTLAGLVVEPVGQQAFFRLPLPGISPALLFGTTASVFVGTAVGVLVASIVGVLPGLVAGLADARGGSSSSVLGAVIRLPSEAALLVPLSVAGLLYVFTFPPAGGAISTAVSIGTISGLVLAGFAFRAVYEGACDAAIPGRSTGDWLAEALMAGGARLDFVAASTVFVAVELVFLGLIPLNSNQVYAGVLQLTVAYQQQSVFIQGTLPLEVLLVPILGAAPVLLALYLLGDGLGEAVAAVRSGGAGPSGAPPAAGPAQQSGEPADRRNAATTAQDHGTSPTPGGGRPQGPPSGGSDPGSPVDGGQSRGGR